eukprot:TRINITY_DN44452_c0_g1_i1.p1 TRINITY_DN44452_c0_g1~~TRINITY_DN44452_c0_g1_i1.p1  ORF type:complete len:211 (-),score=34.75 TRINITY_DN44452_c0_g1_i1:47-679(-)
MDRHMRKGVQLLQELKDARWLPPFNDRLIKEVVEQMLHDTKEMQKLVALQDFDTAPKEDMAGLCLYNDLVERNRRILLAYLNYRLEKIEELRWEVGLMVPQRNLDKLHECEKLYMYEHNKLLDRYMRRPVRKCKEPIDLVADAEAPEDLNVQIRVDDEGPGEIVTVDSGVLRLKKGYQLFVKRTDVEHLIRAGLVSHVRASRAVDDAGGA